MKRVNGIEFYSTGSKLARLVAIAKSDRPEFALRHALYMAREWLQAFTEDRFVVHLEEANKRARLIVGAIDALESVVGCPKDLVYEARVEDVEYAIHEFAVTLQTELAGLEIYLIEEKCGYRAANFLNGAGECVFSASVIPELPDDVKSDVREACKCLVFELPTALGFHIMRAIEAMMLEYFPLLNLPALAGRDRSMGGYLKVLRPAGVDASILLTLEQVRRIRNEIMHPAGFFTTDEAESLFEVAKGAISAIALDLRGRRKPPSVPVPGVVP